MSRPAAVPAQTSHEILLAHNRLMADRNRLASVLERLPEHEAKTLRPQLKQLDERTKILRRERVSAVELESQAITAAARRELDAIAERVELAYKVVKADPWSCGREVAAARQLIAQQDSLMGKIVDATVRQQHAREDAQH